MSLTAIAGAINGINQIAGLLGRSGLSGGPEQFSQVLARLNQEDGSRKIAASQILPVEASRNSSFIKEAQGEESVQPGKQLLEFFNRLKKEDSSLGQMETGPDDLAKLEELLLGSGYSQEQAEVLLSKSLNQDGQLDLDALAGFIIANPPQGGTSFLLDNADRPLFVQVMQDLGLSPSSIDNYLDQAGRHGDKLLLRNIDALLAQAQDSENMADTGRLTSLLGKLGLEKQEIENLLRQSQGQEPGINAKSMFLLLEQAAQKQNQHITQALREMIARGRQDEPTEMSAGMVLRAQMIKSQQYMEGRVEQTASATDYAADSQSQAARNLSAEQNPTAQGKDEAAGPGAFTKALEDKINAGAGSAGTKQETGQHKEQGRKPAEIKVLSEAGTVESVAKGNLSAGAGRTSLLPAYVVRQVAFSLGQMTARNLEHLSLSLKPPSLGEISLDLAVKDGAVKASLVAETVAAKQALEAGLDSLKQHLAGQGIKVQQIEISVQPDAQRRQERAGEKQERRQERKPAHASEATDTDIAQTPINTRLSVRA